MTYKARTVTATDFRVNLKNIMNEVFEEGTTIVVEKHKQTMFVVVPPGRFDESYRDENPPEDSEEKLSDPVVVEPTPASEEVEEITEEADRPSRPSRPSRPHKVEE